MGFRLSIEDGPYVQTLEVRSGALTVGRRPPQGLALSSPGLSERHAILRQVEDGVEIEALATKVGVRLRGDRIDRAVLKPGDSVQLGWARIVIVDVTPEAPAVVVAAPPVAAADTASPLSAPTPPLPPLAFAEEEPRYQAGSSLPVAVAAPAPAPAVPTAVAAPAATIAVAPPVHAPAVVAATPRPVEQEADFVILSRKAVRVLPWWCISVALHAILFAVVMLLPKHEETHEVSSDATIAVTLRQAPPRIEPDAPPVEPTRAVVDVARPDMAVPMETPDSTLPPSMNPRGQGGTAPTRADETLPFEDDGGGSPWAQPGGSSSIGVGQGARIGLGVGTNLDEGFGKGEAGHANAAAAGKLNGDPITRELVNGLRLNTNESNVKVVKGDYDQGELTMDALGLHHGVVTVAELGVAPLEADVRALFFNCTGRAASERAIDWLEKWVSEGGWLFTSDWGIENVVERAFPGYLKSMKNGPRTVMTLDETITFTVAPGRHSLLAGLPREAETSRWWLEESSIPFTIEKPESVEVLVQSADLERKHGSKYVAATFAYGKGRVVHVLGHMYQKEGNLRGAYAMQRLLINFLYQAIKSGGGTGGRAAGGTTAHDTTPPELTLPADITAEATSAAGATVTFSASATDDNRSVPVSCSPASGSTFPLGTTTVECSARDAAGNRANGSFTVTVRDTTRPVLFLPADVTLEATSAAGRAVTFSATASDAVSGGLAVTASPQSGSTFALGTTAVNCRARDAADNAATGSFTVTIRDTTAPTLKDLSVSPTSLAPAERQMVRVVPTFSASDAVTASPSLVVVSVISSEADAGLDDRDEPNDIELRPDGGIYVRAERSRSGGGRVYTMTFQAKDAAGNLSPVRTATVTVP